MPTGHSAALALLASYGSAPASLRLTRALEDYGTACRKSASAFEPHLRGYVAACDKAAQDLGAIYAKHFPVGGR